MKTWLVLFAAVLVFSEQSYSKGFPLDRDDPEAHLSDDMKAITQSPEPEYRATPPSLYADLAVGFEMKTRQQSALPSGDGTDDPVSPPNPGTGKTVHANIVIGNDDRILITPTVNYPWRAITKLYVTYPTGKSFICSGVMISPKYVLSAGHCVYDKDEGGWASKIEVIPGLDGTYKPYGSVIATYMRSYLGWINDGNAYYDISLITLASPIGSTVGWFGFGYYPNPKNFNGNIAGYPGDRDNGLRMYYHYGPVTSYSDLDVTYTIDTAGGQSGSGVYIIDNGNRYCFAAHTYGHQQEQNNSGTRITQQRFNDFISWINSGQ